MKTCFKCLITKDLSEFYAHKMMADGHLNKCKECAKRDAIETRNKRRDYWVEYDRKRANLPHRAQARQEYQKTEAGKKAKKTAIRNYSIKFPEKYKAKIIVGNAIQRGKLIRQPCEVCGEQKAQAHHDDYSKPLEVRWLCVKHHVAHHNAMKGRLNGQG